MREPLGIGFEAHVDVVAAKLSECRLELSGNHRRVLSQLCRQDCLGDRVHRRAPLLRNEPQELADLMASESQDQRRQVVRQQSLLRG